MKEDVAIAGVGSLAIAVTATSALVALSGSLVAAVALGGLLAVTLFGTLLIGRQLRRHRRQLIELRGEGAALAREQLAAMSSVEVAAVRRLREEESNILAMIAGDRGTKDVLASIIEMLSRHYPNCRFRIVNDTLFDVEEVDASWEILPRTNSDLSLIHI